jgi:hypothetical protein
MRADYKVDIMVGTSAGVGIAVSEKGMEATTKVGMMGTGIV